MPPSITSANFDLLITYYIINLSTFQSQSRKKLGKEYRRARKALNKLITIGFFGLVSPSPDTASKRAKGIYETPKKCRVEKTGEISRNLPFSRFSSLGSKLTCHHVSTGQFRCRFCVSQFRCTRRLDFSFGKSGVAKPCV